MDITSEGFLARWVHLPSIKEVTLHVYTRDGDKILPLDGYPRQCFSEDQEARVTGISYDTTYYYRVTSGDMGSNEISVFIPAPVPMISVASLDGDLNFSMRGKEFLSGIVREISWKEYFPAERQ